MAALRALWLTRIYQLLEKNSMPWAAPVILRLAGSSYIEIEEELA